MRRTVSRVFVVVAGVVAVCLSFGSTRPAEAQSFRRQGRIAGREMRQEGRADARAFGNTGNYGYNNYGYNNYGYNNYGPGGYYGPGYGPGYASGYAGGGYPRGGYGMGGYGMGGFGGPGYAGPGYGNYGGYGRGANAGAGAWGQQGMAPGYGNNFANNPPPAPRERAYLGVTMSETPDGIVRVKNVRPESPAAEAGLRPGDEILAINDREVYSYRDVTRMIGRHKPGDVVQIDIERNGTDRNVEVELGEPNAQMAGNYGGAGQGPVFNEPYGGQQYGGPAYGNPAYGNQGYGNQSFGNPAYGGPLNEGPAYGNPARPRTARQATRQRNQSLDPNLYEQNGY